MLRSVTFVLALAASAAPASSTQSTDPEAIIRGIVADQATAWNGGNAEAFASRVAPEVSFTNIFGMILYGKAAFVQRHTEILTTFYQGTTKHHTIRRIRFVTPGVAIVDIDNEVRGVRTLPAGIALAPDGVVKTQLMEVFVQRDGGWWIEAYHNVDVKPTK